MIKEKVYEAEYSGCLPNLTDQLNEAYQNGAYSLYWSVRCQRGENISLDAILIAIDNSIVDVTDTKVAMTYNPILEYSMYHVTYEKSAK